MNSKTTVFFLSILFGACSTNDSTKSKVGSSLSSTVTSSLSDTSFQGFVNSIPILDSSFTLSNKEKFKHIDIQSKFTPNGATLIGRLTPIDHYEFIIYSYLEEIHLPILEVYNSKGKKVNERQLFDYERCYISQGNGHLARLSKDLMKIFRETYCSTAFSSRGLDTIVLRDLIPQ